MKKQNQIFMWVSSDLNKVICKRKSKVLIFELRARIKLIEELSGIKVKVEGQVSSALRKLIRIFTQ